MIESHMYYARNLFTVYEKILLQLFKKIYISKSLLSIFLIPSKKI